MQVKALLPVGAVIALLALAAPVVAQQSGKIPRLCFLTFDPGTYQSRSPRFNVNRNRVTELAARYKLPAVYPWSIMVSDAEGLMAYDANEPDLHWHAAGYVDRILKGAKPSDLAIHRPANLRFVINLKTAKTLGLTIPPTLMVRANQNH
jgi:ABC-type uncharacterized transport system substrate-binding protein